MHDPDTHELEALQKTFGLHQLAIEDALNPRQVPKPRLPRLVAHGQTDLCQSNPVHLTRV
jgi:hypothetical protein